jgi:hypothetical protein
MSQTISTAECPEGVTPAETDHVLFSQNNVMVKITIAQLVAALQAAGLVTAADSIQIAPEPAS